jgi:uncharacterized protein YlxW (UPF0749 family)
MTATKQSKATTAVRSRQRALEKMLSSLEKSVGALQTQLEKQMKDASGARMGDHSKVLKAISDVLGRIYQIRYGKAAQEELLGMIADLQRHFRKAEEHSAERERRARQKPFVEIVRGMLKSEAEITADTEQLEEDTTARARDAQLEYESQLQEELERAITSLEPEPQL